MMRHLKILIWIMAVISIFAGFFAGRESSSFLGYRIPSMDAVWGALGTLILIFLSRILALIGLKKEDFYD